MYEPVYIKVSWTIKFLSKQKLQILNSS